MLHANEKILITGDGDDVTAGLVSALRNSGMTPLLIPRNGKTVLSQIHAQQPAAVLMHAFMPEADAISVMETIQKEPGGHPLFFIMGNGNTPALERRMIESGADYFIMLPADSFQIAGRIRQLLNEDVASVATAGSEEHSDIEFIVTELMHQLGVPAHIKGYSYIRFGILLSVDHREMVGAVTKLLYPAIAKEYHTTPSRVERAIRHAIEVAWERGDIDTLNSVFGYTISNGRGKPTNSEFIAMIADRIRLQQKKRETRQFA